MNSETTSSWSKSHETCHREELLSKRFLGSLCIIAGTATGAAMLALPVSMGRSGFLPSCLAFIGSWAFMLYSALLILELCIRHKRESNIISLAKETLGPYGALVSSLAYVCLLYALLTAYIAALSGLASAALDLFIPGKIPPGAVACLLLFMLLILFTKGINMVDQINRIFSIGMIITFGFVLLSSATYVEVERLKEIRWQYLLPSLSIGFTSFGFHVVIPSVASYMQYSKKHLTRALMIGSAIPLLAYAIWQAVCLGSIPLTGEGYSIDNAFARGMSGADLLGQVHRSPLLMLFSDCFAVTAIATSFLGVALSIVDFVRDGISKIIPSRSMATILLIAFMPPVWFSTTSPQVFFQALEVAGVFGVVVLLALLPTCMVWVDRYGYPFSLRHKRDKNIYPEQRTAGYRAPGGRPWLLAYGVICCVIVVIEAIRIAA